MSILIATEMIRVVQYPKSSILWSITECSPLTVDACFGETYHFYLQKIPNWNFLWRMTLSGTTELAYCSTTTKMAVTWDPYVQHRSWSIVQFCGQCSGPGHSSDCHISMSLFYSIKVLWIKSGLQKSNCFKLRIKSWWQSPHLCVFTSCKLLSWSLSCC
jgi:hypothetical protein